MLVLTLHPYLSGHRAPMRHLEEFVTYIKSKPGVWFATAADIARHVKSSQPVARRTFRPELVERPATGNLARPIDASFCRS
jgi:hypothetical protein